MTNYILKCITCEEATTLNTAFMHVLLLLLHPPFNSNIYLRLFSLQTDARNDQMRIFTLQHKEC